jgi:hypothetical protein
MANTVFQLRRNSTSGVRPTTSSIQSGELAINLTDGKVFSTNGSVIFEVGANLTNQNVTGNLSLSVNGTRLSFTPLSGSSNLFFTAQTDDNFVFYNTNTTGGQKAVFNVYSNTNVPNQNSAFRFNVPIDVSTQGLYANGSLGTSGQVLTSNGSATYWSSVTAGSINTAAQYTWTNTQTFSANVSFTGNNISVGTNTGSVMFNGSSDLNWRIGRDTGSVTKFYYSNNTLDVLAGGSSLEGFTIGQTGGNTYFETGANGTFTRNPIYVGNATVNLAINSTSLLGNTISIASSTTSTFYNYNGQVNAASGNFIANAYATLGGTGGNYLAFGQQTNFAQWIQSGYSAVSPTYYSIILNPLGGNVGIGNTAPNATLQVQGNANISGNVVISGTTTTGNTTVIGNLVVGTNGTNVTITNTSINIDDTVYANSSYVTVANGIFLQPQTSVAPNTSEGSVFYDITNHAFNVYGDDSSTPLELGQQQVFRAVNKTGSTLAFGSAIYINGAQGNRPTVALACANSATTFSVAGFVLNSSGILNNAEGYILTNGLLQGINTSTMTSGAVVYLSATTPGAVTTTEPVFPNYNIALGQALNTTNNGKIYVNIIPNYLAGLPNTAVAISNGTLITYSNNFLFDYSNNVLHIGNSSANTAVGYQNAAGSFSFIQILNNADTSVEESLSNMSIGSNASSDMIMYDSIGITGPNYLDMGINGNGYSQPTSWTINGPSDGYIYTSNSNLSIGTQGAYYLNFFTGNTLSTNERMRITATGNVGIGTSSPAYILDVNGNINSSGTVYATHFDNISDISLKENIIQLTNSIELLSKLNPVSFDWKDSGEKSFGLIAQEVEKILPEIVHQKTDNTKTVSYIQLIPLLIQAIKIQQQQIDNINRKVNA